jgi:hypothetical protein
MFHEYRPVPIVVRDAETKQPIPGAQVRITYPIVDSSFGPAESDGITGPNGIARLHAAPAGAAGSLLEATAPGYMREDRYLTNPELLSIEPAHWFEKVEGRPVAFVMELYAEPKPCVELVVPPSFRGLVKVKLQIEPNALLQPGQRVFVGDVPSSGEVLIMGHRMLQRVTALDYHARFSDGTPLEATNDVLTVGLRWLKCEGTMQYFVIGNQSEFDSARRSLRESESRPAEKTGKSGGRRGRRGNPPPGDGG